MNEPKNATILLLLFVQVSVLFASSLSESDTSLNDLYENLLQREYIGPISFPNHQVERKAQRSPSLRLRFGRRSDPGLSPLQVKRFSDQINKKPIRSPSLRLRFGKRNPSDPTLEDEYNSNYNLYREIRKPSIARLRWGKRSDDVLANYLRRLVMDELEGEILDEPGQNHQTGFLNDRSFDDADDKIAPADIVDGKRAPSSVRLRFGRAFPSTNNELTRPNENENGGAHLEENTNVVDQPSDN